MNASSPWQMIPLRAVLAGAALVTVALFVSAHWGDLGICRTPSRSSAAGPAPTAGESLMVGLETISAGTAPTATQASPPAPAGIEEDLTGQGKMTPARSASSTLGTATLPTPSQEPSPALSPTTDARGLAATFSLRDGRSRYSAGERVHFVLDIENRSDTPASFGLIELRVAGNGAFRTPWADIAIEPGRAFHAEYYLVFHATGTYTVTEAICYGESGACDLEGASWEVPSSGLVVEIG